MNYPSHGMEDWLIFHLVYNVLNPMSKFVLDNVGGGTFMRKQVELKLLEDF
jgi:hypothetical protein